MVVKQKLLVIGEDLQVHLISDILKTAAVVIVFSTTLVWVSNWKEQRILRYHWAS